MWNQFIARLLRYNSTQLNAFKLQNVRQPVGLSGILSELEDEFFNRQLFKIYVNFR
jgi:hypothetical protein